jgi:hypothetical protein
MKHTLKRSAKNMVCSVFAFSCLASVCYGLSNSSDGNKAIVSVKGFLEMESLDKRPPLPLSPTMALHQKQNMREHLEAVQVIVNALTKEDFVEIEKATKRIGYSKQMEQMCTHMGAGAPGFTELALQFHRTADTIGEAARFKDRAAVLKALDKTLQTCTSCHAQFRQQIVDQGSHNMHESEKK